MKFFELKNDYCSIKSQRVKLKKEMGIGSCTFKGKSIGMDVYIYSGSYWFSYPSFHGRHICITFSNIRCYCRLGIKTLNPLKGRLMWFSFWGGGSNAHLNVLLYQFL